MSLQKLSLFGAVAGAALAAAVAGPVYAADAAAAAAPAAPSSGPTAVGELVVTASKREESINTVGLAITAASGDNLQKLGITNTEDLQKIVPGFQATPNYYGTNVFTIRGVGFQDTSLAGSPTVAVYLDEAPLPYSSLTNGATLDLQRVEVLKGPQGTLFGENATGGAINYIANKPTDHFEAGINASYGRFNDADVSGYINGPITDTLDARLALRINQSGAWQEGYADNAGQSIGGKDFVNGRLSLLWKPTSRFKALLTISGWHDEGYNQMGQLFGIAELSPLAPLSPYIKNYPLAPNNDQAASWNKCVNVSPFDPIAGQAAGTQYATIPNPGPNAVPNGPLESMGPGSVAQAGGQPTDCVAPRKNNTFFNPTLRLDYDLGGDLVATSITQVQKFNRTAAIDGSGMAIQDYQSYQRGKISDVYEEARLAGKFKGKGNWIIGANYEYDHTWDSFLQTYNGSSADPTMFLNPNFLNGALCAGVPASAYATVGSPLYGLSFCPTGPAGSNIGANAVNTSGKTQTFYDAATGTPYVVPAGALLPVLYGNNAVVLGPTRPTDLQTTNTYSVYGNFEYPILDSVNLKGGVRFTEEDKTGGVCGDDGGDGTWAQVAYQLQYFYGPPSSSPAASPPGTCASTGPGPTYNSPAGGGLIFSKLDQNNISWHVGLDWKPFTGTLLYANISQGYKGGSYPTVALASDVQTKPVSQEGLLSYEVGFKSTLLDRQLQANGSFFYYDYSDKQILGAVADPVYGSLPALVNVPKSHVIGFEFSGAYQPEWFKGLVITPSVSYQYSKVDRSNKNTCAPPPAQDPTLASSMNNPDVINCKAGDFYGYDAFGEYADFTGEHFPSAPEFQAHLDAEYDWKIHNDFNAFAGVSVSYTSGTTTFFVNNTPIPAYNNIGVNGPDTSFGGYETCSGAASATPVGPCPTNHPNNPLAVPAYTLIDLRLGISKDNWTFQLWGRNVANTYYWTGAYHVNDVLLRYTGMPATWGATFNIKFR
jgi:outer membrane receptor protein involved in Fe transport